MSVLPVSPGIHSDWSSLGHVLFLGCCVDGVSVVWLAWVGFSWPFTNIGVMGANLPCSQKLYITELALYICISSVVMVLHPWIHPLSHHVGHSTICWRNLHVSWPVESKFKLFNCIEPYFLSLELGWNLPQI